MERKVIQKNCPNCKTRWDLEKAPNYCPNCGKRLKNILEYKFEGKK